MAVQSGEQPGVMGPATYPIRDPRSRAMKNGRTENPPRFMEFGGLDTPNDWFGNANTGAQTSDRNIMQLESGGPTGVKGAKNTAEYSKG